MSRDWVPLRESRLVTFTAHFAQAITASPESYGLTADEANEFAALNDVWVSAYTTANRNETRTPKAIVAKDDARDAMLPMLRQLGMYIQRRPQTTNDQRVTLGLRVPSPTHSPIPVPTSAPTLTITSVLGQTIRFTLRSPSEPSRRGKPTGVAGAMIFAFRGDKAPPDMSEWTTLGNFTRTNLSITFAATTYPPGSKLWLAACWFNPKGKPGAMSAAQYCHLAGGGTMVKAA